MNLPPNMFSSLLPKDIPTSESFYFNRPENPVQGAEFNLYEEDAASEETLSTLLGPVMKLKEPLRRLTKPSIDCPRVADVYDIVSCAVKVCTKLEALSNHHLFTDRGASMAIAFPQSMPSNTADSVKSIVLGDCHYINAGSVIWIFVGSPVLEAFRNSSFWQLDFKIPLKDLVEKPWKSTKLRELKLHPQFAKEQEAPNKEEFVFSNSMPRWMIGLERLYRQLTVLTDLRGLDLRVAVERRDVAYITYMNKTFVAVSTLEDQVAARLDWRSYWEI
ncbi:hypothetical protein BG015_011611 [Linnemannia schmuckeri]|uniref:Uncharacterized protein n=1 Tax=Linnemannia schmuckeri TaxID=64567 RepID=A0A9P5S5B3_9FUNG|nr:hypothetical protein BG015_011611 [Linnemannia schmuckeri]